MKAILFVSLSALSVLLYLFLLSVFRGKIGPFSKTIPAVVVALAALYLNHRFLRSDSLSLRDIGLDSFLPRLSQGAIGFGAGCVLVGIWAIVLRVVAGVAWQISPVFDYASAVGAFTFIFFNNAGEELVYRAYLFLLLARTWGPATAVIVTCALFTLLHIQGGVTISSAIAGVLTSSLIFAALFLRWRSVPLVLGFHAATNMTQEFLGIRSTGLTFFSPAGLANMAPSHVNTVLVITGVLNTAIAGAIFLNYRRS